jgi:aconitate hydratase
VIIAESFERIHRSNLVGMGVIPLQFQNGQSRKLLGLTGDETIDVPDLASALQPGAFVNIRIHSSDRVLDIQLISRVDTRREAEWVRTGGVLPYVLKELESA